MSTLAILVILTTVVFFIGWVTSIKDWREKLNIISIYASTALITFAFLYQYSYKIIEATEVQKDQEGGMILLLLIFSSFIVFQITEKVNHLGEKLGKAYVSKYPR